jgi:predicted membrane channel-forming protein YqfA (hemolysin III family)
MLKLVLPLVDEGAIDNSVDPTWTGMDHVQIASLLVGVFLPILVGLVTTKVTSSSVKSLLLLALSAVTGFLTEMINNANFIWQDALLTTMVTFVIAVATHYGLWRPTGVSEKAINTLRTAA